MNIAEILKYCPKGTKLYSLIHGEVTLEKVENSGKYPIKVALNNGITTYYTKDGMFFKESGECILFPSKDQRDWSKFRLPIKRGDIMMDVCGKNTFIASGKLSFNNLPMYICGINAFGYFQTDSTGLGWTSSFYIPASEEAKKELFIKMEIAGYKWNTDNLELERIESKFKEGDVIVDSDNNLFLFTGIIKYNKMQVSCIFVDGVFINCGVSMHPDPISSFKLASSEARDKVYFTLAKKGYKYDKEQHRLINQEFKQFDKVLVRNESNEKWSINLFSYYDEENRIFPYVCLDGRYHHCVPYGGNEYLVGRTINARR